MNAKKILIIIVFAQFCCTSLWFAGNAIMSDLIINFNLSNDNLAYLTSSVQFGFIVGTLLFAILTISDRFSPSKVFFVCASIGGLINLIITWNGNTLTTLLIFRFLTGFFLAGIYPIGMKIASDYFDKGLGTSLGFLVGALVLGTAFPHILKANNNLLSWNSVIYITSFLAITGGLLMYILVPDGPFRSAGKKLNPAAFFDVFKNKSFRGAAFGYFGHMWELYAFWTFIPLLLKTYTQIHTNTIYNIPVLSFSIIAIGSLACIVGSFIANKIGTKKTAFIALLASCTCCIISPFMFTLNSEYLFIGFLIFWGIVVIADSPLFSTLVAQNATPEIKGTALTIVNCIGFAITIISILLLNKMLTYITPNNAFVILALGPIIGLIALKTNTTKT